MYTYRYVYVYTCIYIRKCRCTRTNQYEPTCISFL